MLDDRLGTYVHILVKPNISGESSMILLSESLNRSMLGCKQNILRNMTLTNNLIIGK